MSAGLAGPAADQRAQRAQSHRARRDGGARWWRASAVDGRTPPVVAPSAGRSVHPHFLVGVEVVGVVSAKLNASAALASSGSLPENVNYAVKSSYLLSFLESIPDVSAKLKEPDTKEKKFEEVVKAAEQAAVLVLVY